MCFTVNVNLVKDEIANRYGVSFPDEYRYEPSYYMHAYSMPELPLICSDDPGKVRMLTWGLIPDWVSSSAQAEEIRKMTFNARSDSVSKKPAFSGSFMERRCLIPVAGFFEWQHRGKEKIPYYIYRKGENILSLAGLWSRWADHENDKLLETFSIITTEANLLMSEIHNSKKRMPVILSRELEKEWLDMSKSETEALGMLKPAPEQFLTAHTVGPLISGKNSYKNSPEVIKPYDYYKTGLLF